MASYDPFEQEILGYQQQRETARKLREQAMQPLEGQMISGHYVAPSWSQGLANALRGYIAGKQEEEATRNIQQAGERQQILTAADAKRMAEILRGTPEKQIPFENPNKLPEEENVPGGLTVVPAKPGDLNEALNAANYQSPQFRQMVTQKALERSMAQFAPKEPIKLNKGESLIKEEAGTYKPVYQAPITPEVEKLPEYWDIGLDGKPVFNQERFEKAKELKAVGAPRTTVSVSNKTEGAYGAKLADKAAERDDALHQAAVEAPNKIETIKRTRKILQEGKVFTGMGAEQKLDWARFGQAIGITGSENEVIANTQRLMADRAQATLDSVKTSGLGAGQGFTNSDRQFLENARLGRITYSAEALKRQLDIEEKVARNSVDAWNRRKAALPKSATQPLGYENENIVLPPIEQVPPPAPEPAKVPPKKGTPPPPPGFKPF